MRDDMDKIHDCKGNLNIHGYKEAALNELAATIYTFGM